MNPFANLSDAFRKRSRAMAKAALTRDDARNELLAGPICSHLIAAIDHIEALEAELNTKNDELRRKDDELQTLRFIGQQPETLTGKPPGTLDIVPGPPTLKQRIKAAIAAFKRHS